MLSENEKNTLDTYNEIATDWKSKKLGKSPWEKEYQKFKNLLPAGKILDIGCGFGRDSVFFLNNGYGYLGIDGSESMIKLAKEFNPEAAFQLKDFYKISEINEKFNGFWAAASLLHIPKSSILEVLKSIKEILQDQGVGFISLKRGDGEKDEVWDAEGHKRFFSYYQTQEFLRILKSAGFVVLETQDSITIAESKTLWLTFFIKA